MCNGPSLLTRMIYQWCQSLLEIIVHLSHCRVFLRNNERLESSGGKGRLLSGCGSMFRRADGRD